MRQAHDQLLRELEESGRSQGVSQAAATARSGLSTPKGSSVVKAPARATSARDSLGSHVNANQAPFLTGHDEATASQEKQPFGVAVTSQLAAIAGLPSTESASLPSHHDSTGPDTGGAAKAQKLSTPCASTCANVQVGMSPVERNLQSVASRPARLLTGTAPVGGADGSLGLYSEPAAAEGIQRLSSLPPQDPVPASFPSPEAAGAGKTASAVEAEDSKPTVQRSNVPSLAGSVMKAAVHQSDGRLPAGSVMKAAVHHATAKTSPPALAPTTLSDCPDTEVTPHLSCIRCNPLSTPHVQAADADLECPPTIKLCTESPGTLNPDPSEDAAWVPVVISPVGEEAQYIAPGSEPAPPCPKTASPPSPSQGDCEQQPPCTDMPPTDMELDTEKGQAATGDDLEDPQPQSALEVDVAPAGNDGCSPLPPSPPLSGQHPSFYLSWSGVSSSRRPWVEMLLLVWPAVSSYMTRAL